MPSHYEHPPLIELIAELRWTPPSAEFFGQAQPGLAIQLPPEMTRASEKLFDEFAKKIDTLGFRNSERLLPPGMTGLPGQAMMRYRKAAGLPPLVQIGVGVFTVNGLPPTYTHWGEFSPVLTDAVDALLSVREPELADAPFPTLSLRYVNAFTEPYWKGGSQEEFITGVLGFAVTLPSSISGKTTGPVSETLQLQVPVGDKSNLALIVAPGQANGQPAVILDMTVVSRDVAPNVSDLIVSFGAAHDLIAGIFESVTTSLVDVMKPIGTV
jgi:uncharacterized protein (TIGR04255 family)